MGKGGRGIVAGFDHDEITLIVHIAGFLLKIGQSLNIVVPGAAILISLHQIVGGHGAARFIFGAAIAISGYFFDFNMNLRSGNFRRARFIR